LKDEVGVCCVCVCFYNLIRFLDHIVAFEVYQQLYVDLAEPIFSYVDLLLLSLKVFSVSKLELISWILEHLDSHRVRQLHKAASI